MLRINTKSAFLPPPEIGQLVGWLINSNGDKNGGVSERHFKAKFDAQAGPTEWNEISWKNRRIDSFPPIYIIINSGLKWPPWSHSLIRIIRSGSTRFIPVTSVHCLPIIVFRGHNCHESSGITSLFATLSPLYTPLSRTTFELELVPIPFPSSPFVKTLFRKFPAPDFTRTRVHTSRFFW